MLLLPIRTESAVRTTPLANLGLIVANVVIFLAVRSGALGRMDDVVSDHFAFRSFAPTLWQFFSYQFMHADIMHLAGNMLFLWVFGNSVNAKMGHVAYALFYLAGGVIAALGHALLDTGEGFELVGASGAIAAVTTAYLVLFPRDHVTVLFWIFLFIRLFEVPAMIIIGLKIILWDNILAPTMGDAGNIAYTAHLAGYAFGFVGGLLMLAARAVPRDHFDMLALMKRWNQRREFRSAMHDPQVAARARYGTVARTQTVTAAQREDEEHRLDEIHAIRGDIHNALTNDDVQTAAELYLDLLGIDPRQCLSERDQLTVARSFFEAGRPAEAAAAFDRFAACYPHANQVQDVRLLLGIIYARDLHDYENALRHLSETLPRVSDPRRREQCIEWLQQVTSALGRPMPEV